jgi:hypothetical protein
MAKHLEELQAKKYLEHLIAVDPAQWQWFSRNQCFEVGDAAARPRVYFDLLEQFQTYVLTVYLEVDGEVVYSHVLHEGKHPFPANHDDLLLHLTKSDQLPLLMVLLTRLLRYRHAMATTALPDRGSARLSNYVTLLKQKVLIDLPHNFQERMEIFKIERNASRVLPKTRRS